MPSRRTLGLAVVALGGIGVGVVFGARFLVRSHAHPATSAVSNPSVVSPTPAAPALAPIELHVPRAKTPIVIDDTLSEDAWQKASARTNAFVLGDGSPARPYSDARLLWRDRSLYVGLYAADEDVEAKQKKNDAPLWVDDSFHLEFSSGSVVTTLELSPLGTRTDGQSKNGGPIDWSWSSGARFAVDLDGTLNDPSDDDEEWVIEMELPIDELGAQPSVGTRIGFRARRCDKPKPAPLVCASYGENSPGVVLVLDE